MTRALGGSPAAVDVDITLVLGKPELSVQLDRAKAAELGVQVADVAGTLQVMVGGREIYSLFDDLSTRVTPRLWLARLLGPGRPRPRPRSPEAPAPEAGTGLRGARPDRATSLGEVARW